MHVIFLCKFEFHSVHYGLPKLFKIIICVDNNMLKNNHGSKFNQIRINRDVIYIYIKANIIF